MRGQWGVGGGGEQLMVMSAPMDTVHFISGLVTPIFEDVTTPLLYLPPGWFLHLRKCLTDMNAALWIERQWCPVHQHTHDRCLMLAFINIRGITTSRLYRSNYCRIYTRCITTSDLANLRGTETPLKWSMGKWRATSTLKWPDIPKPPPSWWMDFRYCICQSLSTLHPVRNKQPFKLDKPLGSWHDSPRHATHKFYRTQTHAFTRNGTSFLRY